MTQIAGSESSLFRYYDATRTKVDMCLTPNGRGLVRQCEIKGFKVSFSTLQKYDLFSRTLLQDSFSQRAKISERNHY